MKRIFPRTDLYCLTDFSLSLGRSNVEVVGELLAAGVRLIQYREKERKMGVMLEECLAIRALTREAGACFIVNDHVDIALLADADGVHVGQEDLPVYAVRSLLGPDKIVGVSTHAPEQAVAAQDAGADYIGVGPIFPTRTKKDVSAPVGLEYIAYAAKNLHIPFTAIGGLNPGNLAEAARAGAGCCSLVSAIVGARDIRAAVEAARASMRAGLRHE
ncbi:MAG: thiamine phosphate synthase [Deltaproteobacteria bacterium]|jgi:thiamine-phosphate pyrophosphorylase|nr:thiamine phosphate synthase [Deltaproteobacteria bacterium]